MSEMHQIVYIDLEGVNKYQAALVFIKFQFDQIHAVLSHGYDYDYLDLDSGFQG